MLVELTIRNFAVIRDTRIEFGDGMNALTGETGAGKSIVLDALGAVLGARTSSDFVRTGEDRAYVEAIFDARVDVGAVKDLLSEHGIELEPDEPVVLARDISAGGRSTARVNGRALTAAALTQIGERLVDIHGQSEHLSLLRPAAQLDLLDRYAGTSELRGRVQAKVRGWRALRSRLSSFDTEQRERAQRLDLLQFQFDEIERAAIQLGEDAELQNLQSILTNAERLVHAAAEAHGALSGDDDLDSVGGALDGIRLAESALEEIIKYDSSVAQLLTQIRDALFTLEEIDTELRDYAERVQYDPDRLQETNERLALLRDMTRKYGADIDAVLAYQQAIAAEIEDLNQQDTDVDTLRSEERALAGDIADVAADLSRQRREAAAELAKHVESVIAELNMGRAEFEVRFSRAVNPGGIEVDGETVDVDETGIDRIAFYLAVNRGEELRPLARVASGGEMTRLMLALKSILSEVDETPTLIFDEIDVGVGGRSGQIVGEKLWSLTGHHQVIVISHLPQVAAFADRHTVMVKTEQDERTETSARPLGHEESIDEIATMFDGMPVTPESRANAIALLRRVNDWKQTHGAAEKAGSAPLL